MKQGFAENRRHYATLAAASLQMAPATATMPTRRLNRRTRSTAKYMPPMQNTHEIGPWSRQLSPARCIAKKMARCDVRNCDNNHEMVPCHPPIGPGDGSPNGSNGCFRIDNVCPQRGADRRHEKSDSINACYLQEKSSAPRTGCPNEREEPPQMGSTQMKANPCRQPLAGKAWTHATGMLTGRRRIRT